MDQKSGREESDDGAYRDDARYIGMSRNRRRHAPQAGQQLPAHSVTIAARPIQRGTTAGCWIM